MSKKEMVISVLFEEKFEVDPNSPLPPELQGILHIQKMLDNNELKVVGDSLYNLKNPRKY